MSLLRVNISNDNSLPYGHIVSFDFQRKIYVSKSTGQYVSELDVSEDFIYYDIHNILYHLNYLDNQINKLFDTITYLDLTLNFKSLDSDSYLIINGRCIGSILSSKQSEDISSMTFSRRDGKPIQNHFFNYPYIVVLKKNCVNLSEDSLINKINELKDRANLKLSNYEILFKLLLDINTSSLIDNRNSI